MRTKVLGEGPHALTVSEACLGTMTWGVQNNEADAHAQLDLALSSGVNFIDTAEMYAVPPSSETYGVTEKFIGTWLAAEPSRREKIILATKVSGLGRDYVTTLRRRDLLQHFHEGGGGSEEAKKMEEQFGSVPERAALTRAQIHEALEASLVRLQTTYIDLYQLHWPARYTPIFGAKRYERKNEWGGAPSVEEQVQAMGDLIKAGKIRAWGLSNENGVGVTLFLEAARRLGVPPPATIQNDFSLVQRKFEEDGTAEACSPSVSRTERGVALLVYGALAGGTLSGKISADGLAPAESRHVRFPNFQPRYYSDGTRALASAYAALAQDLNARVSGSSSSSSGGKAVTAAKLALLWARQREYVGSVIVGATSVEQLKENLEAFNDQALDSILDPATLSQIDAIEEEYAASAYYRGVNPGSVKAADSGGGGSSEL